MKREEYQRMVDLINQKRDSELEALSKKYALSNNKVKEGDIVTDHIGSVKVERISVYLQLKVPQCVYRGVEYTKAGHSFKSGAKRDVYQQNLITDKP